MNKNIVFRQTKTAVLTALLNEYFLRKSKYDRLNTSGFDMDKVRNIMEERKKIVTFVEKRLYGKLVLRTTWPNSKDKIEVEITDCEECYRKTNFDIHFNFKKDEPTLNYVYVDSTLTMTLPNISEL